MAEETGADSEFVMAEEARQAECYVDLTVEAEAAAHVEQLACQLEIEKAKVAELEGKNVERTVNLEPWREEGVREQLASEAESALASSERFIESLRAFMERYTAVTASQRPRPEQGGAAGSVEPLLHCKVCKVSTDLARQEDSLLSGLLPGDFLDERCATAWGQDREELAVLRMKELDGEEEEVVERLISRLIEEKRGGKDGRTMWSILKKIVEMNQRDLDHLVDAYNTFGLAQVVDVGSPGADAAAGDPGDTLCVGEVPYLPVRDDAAEPEAVWEHVVDEAIEPEAPVYSEPDDGLDPPPDTTAVYCEVCVIWLNGPKQYESHSIGRKHRKRERDRSRAKSPLPPAPVGDVPGGRSSCGKVFQ